MELRPGELYHIYNQGNNRIPIFFGRDNYLFFLKKMRKHLLCHCDILAWCLMPNHFHWLIKVHDDYQTFNQDAKIPDRDNNSPQVNPLNRGIAVLLSSYTRAINKSRQSSGSLFRSRTKARLLNDVFSDDDYPLTCFLYIHQNPLRAHLVSKMENWEFSSYSDYAGFRTGTLCNIELGKNLFNLPESGEEFILYSEITIPGHFNMDLK